MRALVETVYVAEDGTRFSTETMCRRHEILIAQIEDAFRSLAPVYGLPDDGYFQHDPVVVLAAARALGIVSLPYLASYPSVTREKIDEGVMEPNDRRVLYLHNIGFAISRGDGPRVLDRAWTRLSCIDPMGREWNQPYYANNPPEDARCVGGFST